MRGYALYKATSRWETVLAFHCRCCSCKPAVLLFYLLLVQPREATVHAVLTLTRLPTKPLCSCRCLLGLYYETVDDYSSLRDKINARLVDSFFLLLSMKYNKLV